VSEILYKSNHGRGPLMARVVNTEPGRIVLERWDPRSKPKARRYIRFALSPRYMQSSRCGWKQVKP
jgi:hypothetical protein